MAWKNVPTRTIGTGGVEFAYREPRTLLAGLNDPSSGLILHDRLCYIESKYRLLLIHPDDPAAVPHHVPFHVGSIPLPK